MDGHAESMGEMGNT